MGRRRKAWLINGNGQRFDNGIKLPGFCVRFNDYLATGGRIQRSKSFDKLKSAREWVRRHNAKADLNLLEQIVPTPIGHALAPFMGAISNRARNTRSEYQSTIARFALHLSNIDLSDVKRQHVDSYIEARRKLVSEATTAKDVRYLQRFFTWCIGEGLVTGNPLKHATTRPRTGIVRRKPRITDAQFVSLIAAIDTDDRRVAVQLAATTGLDRGVIAGLTAADIDIDNRCIVTTRIKTHKDVCPHIHDAMLSPLIERMQDHPYTPLFQRIRSQYGRKGSGQWFRLAAEAAGVPDFRFRDLRTFAANWLRGILGDFAAQKILGHSTPAVTAKHYYQDDPKSQQRMSARPLPGSSSHGGRARKPGA